MNNQSNDTLTYTKVGDYYIPDLAMDDQPDKEIGIYSRMRERYLEECHPGRYSYMLLHGKLVPHLLEIDMAAQHYLDTMIPRMAVAAGVTEELKTHNQMEWVGRMNNIRNRAEEIILHELVYA